MVLNEGSSTIFVISALVAIVLFVKIAGASSKYRGCKTGSIPTEDKYLSPVGIKVSFVCQL